MAITTNQATVVCQSGYQPLIRSPLRRGGKTGAFNALEQYGTVAQCFPSTYAAPNEILTAPGSSSRVAGAPERPHDPGGHLTSAFVGLGVSCCCACAVE